MPSMAATKVAVVAAVMVFAAVALPAPAAAKGGYDPRPAPTPRESCAVQKSYFLNCLGRGIVEGCCGVVKDRACFCLVERDTEIRCIRGPSGRRCSTSPDAKKVKLAELDLSCMRNLNYCTRA